MEFLDFFSGIGTIRIGMEQAGHECVGHVEWDKYAQASYMAMHDVKESEFIGWDIRGVRADELPRANAWWFGAPCQDFSIAGKRAGLEGDRSSLVREIFRLVRETEEADRPEWLLYENVKGMLSSNGGFDFLGIILEMDELGYDIEWQTLNSKDFGVPQNRERVFTIGHSRRFGRREILPIGKSDEEIGLGISDFIEEDEQQTDIEINVFGKTNPARATSANVYGVDGIMGAVCARDYKQPKTIAVIDDQAFIDNISDKYSFVKRKMQQMFDENSELPERFNPYNNYEIKETAPTLTAACDRSASTSTVLMKQPNFRIRKLTPKECFRLQGIPDEYFDKAQKVNSDSQLYKQAGNACTVNVIYEIAKRLEAHHEKD